MIIYDIEILGRPDNKDPFNTESFLMVHYSIKIKNRILQQTNWNQKLNNLKKSNGCIFRVFQVYSNWYCKEKLADINWLLRGEVRKRARKWKQTLGERRNEWEDIIQYKNLFLEPPSSLSALANK